MCSHCGRAVAEGNRFCGGCGTSLAEACLTCGGPLEPAAAFCTHCGTPREGSPAAGAPSEDRRRVSVLFVDLVDFTPYAERTDPEQVRQLQHRFYAAVLRVVGQYGGVVEKYIGDAVMALFGAPVATETDALRCVRAGLELHRVLGGLAPEQERLRFRVGIASGEALVDVAAARNGGQAIVAGDVVNTAARLQAVAPEGGVLVCGQTHAVTVAGIRYSALPPVTLRGRSSPTEVWLAVEPAPPARAEPDPTPLVEREHELDLLTGALERAVRDRTPQLVTIFGHAGIGKTRLVRELRRRAGQVLDGLPAVPPLVWHTGHCPPFGENVTYAGLADIVKAEAGILDSDDATTTRHRLARATRRVVGGPEADRIVESLQPLVGLPGSHLPAEAEEAESAWRRFLVALARNGPTVLVFEDLHWADEAMLRFIDLLATAARDAPLLVLCTSRPELMERDASWAGTIAGSLTITLAPLRSSSMTTLCRHLLGAAAFTPEALRPLIELTNGNPLYAQEYVRMLVERGTVTAGLGKEIADGGDAPMPESVYAVIANRLDLLDPADRAVLQAASVVGMQFWPGAVAAALGRPTGPVERSLRKLEQRDFVVERLESTMAGQSEFQFGHVLVRDVCYQRLPRTERVARHARTADWLESLSHRRDTDLAEVLAHHRLAACEIARTVGVEVEQYAPAARQALYLAARRAYALFAMDTAARHAGRALGLLPPVAAGAPEEPALELERLRLELLVTEISFYGDRTGFLAGGGTDQLLTLAQRLSLLAGEPYPSVASEIPPSSGVAAGATAEAARAWTLLGQVSVVRAAHAEALEHLQRAIALFDPLPDSPEKVDAHAELARLHMLNYDCAPAMAAAGTAAAIAERLGLVEARANGRITVATARYESGDPAGLAELRQVTEECRTHRLAALPRAVRNLAYLVREEGDYPGSEAVLATEAAQELQTGRNVLTDHSREFMEAYFAGDLAAMVALAEEHRSPWTDHRALLAVVHGLRDEPPGPDDPGAALAAARATGFRRTIWYGLGMTALCRALYRRYAEAAALVGELATEWTKVSVIASGGWINTSSLAAALTGPEPAEALRVPLATLPRHSLWSEAALLTVTGALYLAEGRPEAAAARHLAAANRYAQIPSVTDRMLALALAAAARVRGGLADQAEPLLVELREFAGRSGATGLLRIAETGAAGGHGLAP